MNINITITILFILLISSSCKTTGFTILEKHKNGYSTFYTSENSTISEFKVYKNQKLIFVEECYEGCTTYLLDQEIKCNDGLKYDVGQILFNEYRITLRNLINMKNSGEVKFNFLMDKKDSLQYIQLTDSLMLKDIGYLLTENEKHNLLHYLILE